MKKSSKPSQPKKESSVRIQDLKTAADPKGGLTANKQSSKIGDRVVPRSDGDEAGTLKGY